MFFLLFHISIQKTIAAWNGISLRNHKSQTPPSRVCWRHSDTGFHRWWWGRKVDGNKSRKEMSGLLVHRKHSEREKTWKIHKRYRIRDDYERYYQMRGQWGSCCPLTLVRTTGNAFGWVTKEIEASTHVPWPPIGLQAWFAGCCLDC